MENGVKKQLCCLAVGLGAGVALTLGSQYYVDLNKRQLIQKKHGDAEEHFREPTIHQLNPPPNIAEKHPQLDRFTDPSFQNVQLEHLVHTSQGQFLVSLHENESNWYVYDPKELSLNPVEMDDEKVKEFDYLRSGTNGGPVLGVRDDCIFALTLQANEKITTLASKLLCKLPENNTECDMTWSKRNSLIAVCFVNDQEDKEDLGWTVYGREMEKKLSFYVYESSMEEEGWKKLNENVHCMSEELKISDDGSRCVWLAYLSHIPEEAERGEYYTLSLHNNGSVEQLTHGAGRVCQADISSDGNLIVYQANHVEENIITTHLNLWLKDVNSKNSAVNLTGGNIHIEKFGWINEHEIWYTEVEESFFVSYRLQISNLVTELIQPPIVNEISWANRSEYFYGSEDHEHFMRLFHTQGDNIFKLPPLSHPSEFEQVECTRFDFKAKDGTECCGYLFSLEDTPMDAPIIAHIHGGPAARWPLLRSDGVNTTSYPNRHFIFAGYRVYVPIFRGTMGFGDEFSQGNFNNMGGLDNDLGDIISGLEFLETNEIIPRNVPCGIYGGSYGGYMTIKALATTDRFDCGIAMKSFIFNRWMTYAGNDFTWEHEYFGQTSNVWPLTEEVASSKSDVWNQVSNITAPLLFLHGKDDDICLIDQAEVAYRILLQNDVPTGLIAYDGEKHGWKNMTNRRDVDRRTLDWFLTYLPIQKGI